MTDTGDATGGGAPAPGPAGSPAGRPVLPPHMDPRGARGALPPRPPRSVPPRPVGSRKVAATAPTGGPRTGRLARALSWVAAITSFAVLVTAGAGWAMLRFYDDKITRIPGLSISADDRPADVPRDAKNILIVGSDSRGELEAGQGTQGKGASFVTGQRSDTVILAHLYGDADQAQLVSFPRDSWVQIPSYVSPETGDVVPAHEGKLNAAFAEGGPALLIDTIEDLTGVYVDHYMQIDFDGFQAVVNELDGVEVCLPEAAKEPLSGIDLEAGRQVIKGEQALAFVRQRHGLPNGDIDRIRRQQQFIGAIVRKVLSAGTLLNPVKLNGVITVATSALQVDEDLTIGQLQQLAFRMRSFDAGGVTFTTVPVEGNGRRDGQSVVLLDEEGADALFDGLRLDVAPGTPEPAAPAPSPEEALIVAPESIRVKVLNGAGIAGLGRRAAGDLEGVGFQIVGAPENRGTSQRQTVVLHGPDRADSARTVAAALPGATTQLDPNLTRTVEVVVGASYDGTKPVTVTGQAPAEEAPAASAPPVVTAASDPCAV